MTGTASDYELSTQAVFRALGMPLVEVDDWSCCGASPAHFYDPLLAVSLAARNLNLARKQGAEQVVTACAACFSRLKVATHEIEHDPKMRQQVEEVLEEPYLGGVRPRHVLEILRDDVGPERIRAAVKRPLTGLKVVEYYGCILVRPPKVMRFDDVENPTCMRQVLEPTGCEFRPWPAKTDCCGASLSLSRAGLVTKLVRRLLIEARDAGAEVIAVACPLCHTNLDLRQLDLLKEKSIDFRLPVVYFTQLLGLSLGSSWDELGLARPVVDTRPVLRKYAA
jgi:heterodisulfide reductase subunit B